MEDAEALAEARATATMTDDPTVIRPVECTHEDAACNHCADCFRPLDAHCAECGECGCADEACQDEPIRYQVQMRTVSHIATEDQDEIKCECGITDTTPEGLGRRHVRSRKVIPAVYRTNE